MPTYNYFIFMLPLKEFLAELDAILRGFVLDVNDRHWTPAGYMQDGLDKLKQISNSREGLDLLDNLVKREEGRCWLDDGSYFDGQNNICLLGVYKACFGYASRHEDQVAEQILKQMRDIVFTTHCLMDYGGCFNNLAEEIDHDLSPASV